MSGVGSRFFLSVEQRKLAARKDLDSGGFPPVTWDTPQLSDSLEKVYEHVVGKAAEAENWYVDKKRWKRQAGFAVRVAALVTGALAGVLPVLSEIYEDAGTPLVAPGWSAVLIAVTGLCIMLDKFGGYTSGWVRYVLTAQQIGQQINDFRFAWAKWKISLAGVDPTVEQTQHGLALCHEFTGKVAELVGNETKQWAGEFESALKQIESAAKDVTKPEPLTAINVQVVNGNQTEGDWSLQIDDATPVPRRGVHASVHKLRPGMHVVRVQGKIAGKDAADEKAVKTVAGEISEIELELKATQ